MRSSPHHDLLAQCPLFDRLTPQALRILENAPLRRLRRGEALWTAGGDTRGLHVILSGRVRVTRSPLGRQYAVHTEGPGGTLGDVPFFAGGRYPATAIALEATTCLVIDPAMLTRAIAADPSLAWRLLERLAARVRTLVARLDDRASTTVEQRAARLLLERHHVAGSAAFRLAATQAEAAEELGTVREVLVRTLTRLRRAGVIDSPAHGRYRVVRLRALQRLSEGR